MKERCCRPKYCRTPCPRIQMIGNGSLQVNEDSRRRIKKFKEEVRRGKEEERWNSTREGYNITGLGL